MPVELLFSPRPWSSHSRHRHIIYVYHYVYDSREPPPQRRPVDGFGTRGGRGRPVSRASVGDNATTRRGRICAPAWPRALITFPVPRGALSSGRVFGPEVTSVIGRSVARAGSGVRSPFRLHNGRSSHATVSDDIVFPINNETLTDAAGNPFRGRGPDPSFLWHTTTSRQSLSSSPWTGHTASPASVVFTFRPAIAYHSHAVCPASQSPSMPSVTMKTTVSEVTM